MDTTSPPPRLSITSDGTSIGTSVILDGRDLVEDNVVEITISALDDGHILVRYTTIRAGEEPILLQQEVTL